MERNSSSTRTEYLDQFADISSRISHRLRHLNEYLGHFVDLDLHHLPFVALSCDITVSAINDLRNLSVELDIYVHASPEVSVMFILIDYM